MNRNDDLLNQGLKTEQAGCRKDDTQCCGKCVKPTYEQLAAQLKQSQIDAECYKRGMDASNKLIADVVAENVALKKAIPPLKMVNSFDDSWDDVSIAEDIGFNHAISTILRNLPETPATDRFLAEQRAMGVEMYAANLDSGADDAERGGFDDAVKFLQSEASAVRLFATQLRNEVKV